MEYVLFVCNHNAGRSQMAQAFFERHAPPGVRAESAGTQPADAIWPEVIGAGIAAQRLSPGDVGLQLFENATATAAGLFTIILMFGPVSGGHFNPVVSLADASFGGIRWRDALAYIPAQLGGCVLGAIAA